MMKLQRGEKIGGTNLIGREEAVDAPFGYTKYERVSGSNMPPRHNSVKIRFNSSSCSVKFSAAQYQLWKCTFRLYNNHFMKLNLFSNVLRLHFRIYIRRYSNFLNGLNKDFPKHAC